MAAARSLRCWFLVEDRTYNSESEISRSVTGADRRYQMVDLTESGRQIVPDLAALADASDAEFFGQLSASEQEALRAILQAIVASRKLRGAPLD